MKGALKGAMKGALGLLCRSTAPPQKSGPPPPPPPSRPAHVECLDELHQDQEGELQRGRLAAPWWAEVGARVAAAEGVKHARRITIRAALKQRGGGGGRGGEKEGKGQGLVSPAPLVRTPFLAISALKKGAVSLPGLNHGVDEGD